MQRREDGFRLTIVAFGPSGTRADELLGTLSGLKSLRSLEREGWMRRELGLDIDVSDTGAPNSFGLHVTLFAYGLLDTPPAFVPNLSFADGVLLFDGGDETASAALDAALGTALDLRLGAPPRIIERVPRDEQAHEGLSSHFRALITRLAQALRDNELVDFWELSATHAAEQFERMVFGELTAKRIREIPGDELLGALVQIAYERGARAMREHRFASPEEYGTTLGPRWRELLATNAIEVQTVGAGLGSLFGNTTNRAVQPSDIEAAIALYQRIGASEKADVLRAALAIAERDGLWGDRPSEFFESPGWHELAALTHRFQSAPSITTRVAELLRADADAFVLPPYRNDS